jgi:hypothetical protein
MAERYTLEDHEAYRRKVDEAARKKQQELAEKMEKAEARNAWLSEGGNPDTFEAEWPRLRRANLVINPATHRRIWDGGKSGL